jgi:hypothetical protein
LTSENEDLQECKTAAQAALAQIMAYLEPICRTLQAEEASEPTPEGNAVVFLPDHALCLLHDAGHLEGLRLKAMGALSGDLLGLIQELDMCFEVAVKFDAAFKLPFVGGTFQLECKSMNPWRLEAWRIFHGGLLSAYALQPLHLESQGPESPLEATMVVLAGEEPRLLRQNGIAKEITHSANNLITGILNYASLILKETPAEGQLVERVTLIQEAARKLAAKLIPGRQAG